MKKNAYFLKVLIALLLVFLVVIRFVNINLIPIFIDETFSLNWVSLIEKDISNIFISLSGGQLPLYIWILLIVKKVAINSSLFIIGRNFTVFSDLITSILVYYLSSKLFNKTVGLVSIIFYLSFPLNLIHGRLIMLETFMNMFSVATAVGMITLLMSNRSKNYFKYCIFIIISAIFAFITKPSAIVNLVAILLLPFFIILKPAKYQINKKEFKNFLKKLLLPVVFATTIIFIINLLTFSYTSTHVSGLNNSLTVIKFNFFRSLIWLRGYITDPVLLMIFSLFIPVLLRKKWKVVWLFSWLIIILVFNSIFGKNYYPRHIYSVTVPISIITGYSFYIISEYYKKLSVLVFLILLICLWYKNYFVLTNPKISMVGEDKQQFYEDWSSGFKFDLLATKLNTINQGMNAILYIEDEPLTSWSFTQLFKIPNIYVKSSSNLLNNKPKFYQDLVKYQAHTTYDRIYILLNHNPEIPADWDIDLIFTYEKSKFRSVNLLEYSYKPKSD